MTSNTADTIDVLKDQCCSAIKWLSIPNRVMPHFCRFIKRHFGGLLVVRPPNLVPSRMNNEVRNSSGRCFRGRRVAVPTLTGSGVQAVKAFSAGRQPPFWAGCVDRLRPGHDKVPRSRARIAGQGRGSEFACFTAGSSVKFGSVCRCHLAQLGKVPGSQTGLPASPSRTRLRRARDFKRLRQAHVYGGLTTASSARKTGHHLASGVSASGAHAER